MKLSSIVVAVLSAWFAGDALAANITARADRNRVPLNESFVVTYQADGAIGANPDFAPLASMFGIINTRQDDDARLTNGTFVQFVTWRLELMPRETGTFTIPSLSFGRDSSPEITVTVVEAQNTGSGQAGADIVLEVEVDADEAYVQSQILYTVRLLVAVPVFRPQLSQLAVDDPDAIIETLTDNVRYTVERDGRQYQVLMLRYAVFPQRSGTLNFAPMELDARVGGRGRPRSSPRRVVLSDALSVEVKPVPPEAAGVPWIPARAMALAESWSEDPLVFRAGEAVTRTVAVIAEGVTAEQLPEFASQPPAEIRQYLSPPETQNRASNAGLTAIRKDEIAVVPSREGDFELPPVELHWWNVEDGVLETAFLPARKITVLPSADADTAVRAEPVPVTIEPAAKTGKPPEETPDSAGGSPSPAGYWLAAALGLGWLVTAGVWWRSARKAGTVARTNTEARTASLRNAESSIRDACRRNDAAAAKQALLGWARRRWPRDPPLSLEALAERLGASFRSQALTLSETLYGRQAEHWDGKTLWNTFESARPRDASSPNRPASDLLPLRPEYRG